MTTEAFAAWQSLVFGAAHDPPRALSRLQDPPPGLTSEQWARGQFWKACLYCHAGERAEALAALAEVDRAGHWLSPNRLQDRDLDPLRDVPEFTELERKWTHRLNLEAAAHTATLEVLPAVCP